MFRFLHKKCCMCGNFYLWFYEEEYLTWKVLKKIFGYKSCNCDKK